MKGLGLIVPLKWIEYGVYGDLIMTCPKPYSIYLRGTIRFRVCVSGWGSEWPADKLTHSLAENAA